MANTYTNLTTDAFKALDVVSREMVGMIPSVTLDADVAKAALNQDVRVHITPVSNALSDVTPAMALPSAAYQTIDSTTVTITKSKTADFSWTGEDQRGLDHAGAGHLSIQQNQIAQAMRRLTNSVENDLCGLHTTFSRANGTAGSTPFATAGDYTDASETLKILKDNGSPLSDNQLVIDTSAGAKIIGKQADVNRQGSDSILRQGILLDTAGMALRESAQIYTSTKGTGASATTDAAGYAVGATVITLASAGTGTIVAGDVVTFAGDTNQYVVASGDTNVADGGSITLAEPGLLIAMSAATKAITVVANSARNMCFNRSAIILATRMPVRPREGDLAIMVEEITDPRSGLTFELSVYPGNRMVTYQIGLAWGVKNIKPAHTALLLG